MVALGCLSMSSPSRTRLIYDEHELGSWTRAVREPDPRLSPLLYRPLLGFEQRSAAFTRWLEPPRPALTLMIDLGGSLCVDGGRLPDAWMAGLRDRYVLVEFGGRYASLDLELTPLGAHAILGRPLSDLQGQLVTLENLFGASGRRLAERLREARDWDARFDVIEAFLLARAAAGPAADPAVAWACERLDRSEGRVSVSALAREVGCSRRYLHARFRTQVGLAPKTLARLVRFHAVRRRIERAPARWADVALDAGYCDQSHLNRDFRELAGTTPSDFLSRLLPGYGGVVGDEIPFVQDAGSASA